MVFSVTVTDRNVPQCLPRAEFRPYFSSTMVTPSSPLPHGHRPWGPPFFHLRGASELPLAPRFCRRQNARTPLPRRDGEGSEAEEQPSHRCLTSAPRWSRRPPPHPTDTVRGDPLSLTCAGQVNCPLRRGFAAGKTLVRRFRGATARVLRQRSSRATVVSLQLHDGHAVLPLAVAAQAEGFHRAVAAEGLMDRLPQGAGPLAMDDADSV